MKKCEYCASPIWKDQTYCSKCGAPKSEKIDIPADTFLPQYERGKGDIPEPSNAHTLQWLDDTEYCITCGWEMEKYVSNRTVYHSSRNGARIVNEDYATRCSNWACRINLWLVAFFSCCVSLGAITYATYNTGCIEEVISFIAGSWAVPIGIAILRKWREKA